MPRRARPRWSRREAAVVAGCVLAVALVVAIGVGVGVARTVDPAPPAASVASGSASASAAATPTTTPDRSNTPPTTGAGSDAAAAALVALAGVPVAEGSSELDYDRDLFGQRWADVDRNGCDTRNDVLRRDLVDLVVKAGTNGCKVLAGLLLDPYDGVTVRFLSGDDTSRLIQIDHIVALSWAWRHGADTWTDDHRRAFANDPANLQTTTEQANSSKGDSGPAEWLPSTPEGRCDFAIRFVEVVTDYALSIDASDVGSLEAVLEGCA